MANTSFFENKNAVYFTLGCKLNFAETSTIAGQLAERGVRNVKQDEKADFCIINTCSVTELADKKSRQAIRRICRQHPEAFVVVVGCYAQLKPDEIRAIEGVDLVLGTDQKANLPEYLIAAQTNKADRPIVVSPTKDLETFTPSCSMNDRTRHFLKVQDGCDYYCSYCTIPYARGRSRNGSIADLTAMAYEAGRNGGKEIVLTGINIGDFGKTTGESFFDLIRSLDQVDTIDRFRISSIEPNLLTDEMIDFIAASKRFAPHFHIPLQSGCDEVLRLMRRKYDTSFFASKINTIKTLIPDAFIGVDVIAGIRGETDTCFEKTRAFVAALPVSKLHVFTYSERPGTHALTIEPVVDPQTRQQRSKQLMAISNELSDRFCRSQQGKTKKVLFEHTRKGTKMFGFTENYVKVEAEYDETMINRLMTVTLGDFNADHTALTIIGRGV
ncbi:MAG: tRNA (N(6)-L-threonylcarbamoyladenosine(37)-C(2))-methylthiotransferase MtaB [Dysgonamonadaceae bacterium]|jgi:threonylcarbamoyladenosine tRNA methylthiotransferase MtaB|nr:tRNA (N(6)-L-threonylcarbamoyladenosine(37)-C(2))-methylthiotransferase MtaB [Dysgonamonadaceae bacterium]